MTKATYSARKLANSTNKLAAWGLNVNQSVAAGTAVILAWGQQAVLAIREHNTEPKAIAAAIVESYCSAMTAAKLPLPKPPADMRIGDCGSVLKGRYYSAVRIAADETSANRLIAGEAFGTVAKEAPAVQQQASGKRKGGKAKGKASTSRKVAKGITLDVAVETIERWIADAIKAGPVPAAELANSPVLARIVPALASLQSAVTAAKKPAKRKARKAA